MSKEIIVNKIDVSKCKHYKDKHCLAEMAMIPTKDNLCKCFSECYYKQQVSLEQQLETKDKEIEELKNKIQIATEVMTLARDTAYSSDETDPVRVFIDKILTEALKQIEKEKE